MNNLNKLLLKTAFACMVCDGDIDDSEVKQIKDFHSKNRAFGEIILEKEIDKLIESTNNDSNLFIRTYFEELSNAELSKKDELKIIETAIKVIEADEKIEYNEIRFFKIIRSKLKISNEEILKLYPALEEYLETDIISESYLANLQFGFFDSSNLPHFQSLGDDFKDK